MHHTVNMRTQFIQQTFHHWSICASRTQHQFTSINGTAFHFVCQAIMSAINEFFGNSFVKTFGIFLCKILCKNIMSRRSQSIATHSAVVCSFIRGLTARRKSHNHISWTYICIVNHLTALHTTSHRAIHDDCAHQIANICRFTASGINANTHFAKTLQQFVRTIDDSTDYFTRYKHLVSANSRRNQDIVYSTHAKQIVCIHNECILSNAFPHREIASLFPIHISQT